MSIEKIKVAGTEHDLIASKLSGVTATATELNYVDGVTSNIQTQLNGKAASTHTHTAITNAEIDEILGS